MSENSHAHINLWNIFTGDDQIPMDDSHRICSIYINDQNQDTTSTFILERLAYWEYQKGSYFANRWRFIDPIHHMDLIIEPLFDDQVVPFILNTYFWEGSCSITGTVDSDSVKGTAFAELLHIYEDPSITVIAPNGGEVWDGTGPVVWRLNNPDDGNPLTYDLFYSSDGGSSYILSDSGITDTSYFWDVSGLTLGENYLIKIVGYSVDTTIVGTDVSDQTFSITPTVVEAEIYASENTSFKLFQNYPNPFNAGTTIALELPSSAKVNLSVYNIAGQKVRTLISGVKEAGRHFVSWDGKDERGGAVSSGIYLCRLKAQSGFRTGEFIGVRRMALLR